VSHVAGLDFGTFRSCSVTAGEVQSPPSEDLTAKATRKQKGDLAELVVASDLRRRGCTIAIPFGEDSDYDLVVDHGGALERVQVKYVESDGKAINVHCRSQSLTNGKVRRVKRYTKSMIEWLAVYDRTTDCCYYIPASELGDGRRMLTLRLTPPGNSQRVGIRFARDYREPVVVHPALDT
jgi:hypothetical protein